MQQLAVASEQAACYFTGTCSHTAFELLNHCGMCSHILTLNPNMCTGAKPCQTLQVLEWTAEAYKRAKVITRELRSSLSLVQVGNML
jgi:hypothetical protein